MIPVSKFVAEMNGASGSSALDNAASDADVDVDATVEFSSLGCGFVLLPTEASVAVAMDPDT